jgi:GT2 family glycosyltransferase
MGPERIALIVPTCGRARDLAACLESIGREAQPALRQIVVVDDASQDPPVLPREVTGARVDLLRNAVRRGAAVSRNRALAALDDGIDAAGFLDDDVRLCSRWLEVARRELTPDRGAVTGPVRRFDTGLIARARQLRYDRRYAPLEPGQPVPFLAGGNALVWRHLLVRAGGFPETPTMSDTLFVQRLEALGARCHFIPELLVQHRNSKGLNAAVTAAWHAGRIEGARRPIDRRQRVADGLRAAPSSSDPPAALLNVALDVVFVAGHALPLSTPRPRSAATAETPPAMAVSP